MTRRAALSRGVAASLVLLLLACGCTRRGADWRILQLYSGETTVDVLAHPAKVQLFRVVEPGTATPRELHVGPYPASGEPVELPAPSAAELSQILSDAASYEWQRTRPDPFRPQVGVWFVRGAYVLAVAIDLASGRVSVHAGDQFLGTQPLEPAARQRLLALACAALPADPVLVSLR